MSRFDRGRKYDTPGVTPVAGEALGMIGLVVLYVSVMGMALWVIDAIVRGW